MGCRLAAVRRTARFCEPRLNGGKGGPPMNAAEQQRLRSDVEAFCRELREHEEISYVEHHFNDRLIPLAKKYNLLGIPVPVEYGGRGADAVSYARALARTGQD